MEKLAFTPQEKEQTMALYHSVFDLIAESLQPGDLEHMRQHLADAMEKHQIERNIFGLNPILLGLQTAQLVVEEIGLRRDAVIAIMMRTGVEAGYLTVDDIQLHSGTAPNV